MDCQIPALISETRVGGMVLGGGKRWVAINPLRATLSHINRKATSPVAESTYRVVGFSVPEIPVVVL